MLVRSSARGNAAAAKSRFPSQLAKRYVTRSRRRVNIRVCKQGAPLTG
jgi:hypothetical protein